MHIIEESQQWKREADIVLEESGLLTALSQFGTPTFTGSYDLDLMMSGDIDIYLETEQDTKEISPHILAEAMKNNFWNYYMVHDWVHFHNPDFPHAYYLGFQRKSFNDHPWKADIWLFKQIPEELSTNSTTLKSKLTPENREIILTLKKEMKAIDSKFPSVAIYTAVLEQGVNSIEEMTQK